MALLDNLGNWQNIGEKTPSSHVQHDALLLKPLFQVVLLFLRAIRGLGLGF